MYFDYSKLSPNRRQFIHTAREYFPNLSDKISLVQIDELVQKGINKPQWLTIPANRAQRGYYYIPYIEGNIVSSELDSDNNNSVVLSEESDEEIENRIADTYDTLETLVSAVSANTVNALVVSGGPGIGKSYTVNKILSEIDEYNFVFHRGYLKATHLFRLLWENRHPGMVIVIDDSDKIFGEEDSLNLLKVALELKPVRRIGWGSEKEFVDQDNEIIPRYFDYCGSVIFLTNKDIQKEASANTKHSEHIAALGDRALVLSMKIRTSREYLIAIKKAIKEGMLVNKGFTQDEENEIMNFFEEHVDSFEEISLRTIEKVAALYRANHSKWQKLTKKICFK